MRIFYAIKAVIHILLTGEDAIGLVEHMYKWTNCKNTEWAIKAKRLLGE